MSNTLNIKNKRARFEYHLLDEYSAGIQLTGTEIKSIRNGKASILEAYCVLVRDEVFIRNMHISEYENGSFYNHKPKSDRTKENLLSKKIKPLKTCLRYPSPCRKCFMIFVNIF